LSYPTDLKDKEWALIQHHFQAKDRRGSASKHSRKHIVDAILYICTTGAQWRLLPKDFPPWKTVYGHFSRWNKSGVWEAALDQLNKTHRKKTASTRPQLRHYRLTKHENPV
jgi:putative transposase